MKDGRYLRLAAALGARTRGVAAGDGVTAAAATAAAAAADGAAAPSQLHGMAGNLYPVKRINPILGDSPQTNHLQIYNFIIRRLNFFTIFFFVLRWRNGGR